MKHIEIVDETAKSIVDDNFYLQLCLQETAENICNIFGDDTEFVLESVIDPESYAHIPQLFLLIKSKHSPEESRALLEKFDWEYWLDKSDYELFEVTLG